LGNPVPETPLDTYPRLYQMSNGRVFVAFDVNTVEWPGASPSAVPNTPGRAWALLPRYDTQAQAQWELRRGPAALQPEGADPSGDRHYAPCVLIHRRGTVSGTKDRLMTFGGSYDANFFNASPDGAMPNWVATDSVQEFEPLAPSPPETGQWRSKAALAVRRVYPNAIVLPTGQVLIVGGTETDPRHAGTPLQDPIPVLRPEIYDIGAFPSSSGSTSGLLAQSNNAQSPALPTPRLYHSMAMLLPDGRVFVVGGRFAEHSTIVHSNSLYSGELYCRRTSSRVSARRRAASPT